ncbi:MAG: type II toxin-antitoxin system VapC family toxin [Deltaproteobacteria bacterium]|nr:type II toxin-antitoxin system VapC family toxin [Deltaproteobacteria bacterium]
MRRQQQLLLDTHVFLWWRTRDHRLDRQARDAIIEAQQVFVSAASAWEAGIKAALGRLRIPESMEAGVLDSGFTPLAITFAHAEAAALLPPHHGDHFDRLLIAQAIYEGLTLVSHDERLKPYRVPMIWT